MLYPQAPCGGLRTARPTRQGLALYLFSTGFGMSWIPRRTVCLGKTYSVHELRILACLPWREEGRDDPYAQQEGRHVLHNFVFSAIWRYAESLYSGQEERVLETIGLVAQGANGAGLKGTGRIATSPPVRQQRYYDCSTARLLGQQQTCLPVRQKGGGPRPPGLQSNGAPPDGTTLAYGYDSKLTWPDRIGDVSSVVEAVGSRLSR